jgi:YhcH/YjgK/YiaL family protein
MIYDTFENLAWYASPGSRLYAALVFARDVDRTIADGRHVIDGERMYALVSTYETRPRAELRFEAHRRYFDVQALLEGAEAIDACPPPAPETIEAYDAGRDVLFTKAPPAFVSLALKPGGFAVFYPQDLHRPACRLDEGCRVRKIVVKGLIE